LEAEQSGIYRKTISHREKPHPVSTSRNRKFVFFDQRFHGMGDSSSVTGSSETSSRSIQEDEGTRSGSASETSSEEDDASCKNMRRVAADPIALSASLRLRQDTPIHFSNSAIAAGNKFIIPDAFRTLLQAPPSGSVSGVGDDSGVEDITRNPMWLARAKRLERKWRCYDARLVAFHLALDVRREWAAAADPAAAVAAAGRRGLRFRINGASSRCVRNAWRRAGLRRTARADWCLYWGKPLKFPEFAELGPFQKVISTRFTRFTPGLHKKFDACQPPSPPCLQ
jgi:hypothetical protein